ncbi:MAG TPA: site-specific DNA-methyltransferase, partial [Acidimicrobiia bacterium]
ERVGLSWPGKADAVRAACTCVAVSLVAVPDASADANTTGHTIIEGDNLDALELLRRDHAAAVKLIYIDPPYNTGRDVLYPDRFDHASWLSMMYPRLVLARELLRSDGFICVSIGNEELAHLRLLLDEIFGEEHFVALMVRRAMHTVRNSSKDFNHHADYVLMYARDKTSYEADPRRYLREACDKRGKYTKDDGDGRGAYKLDPICARNYNRPYRFVFRNGVEWEAPEGSYPRYSEATLRTMDADGRIAFGGKNPMAKRYLADVQEGRPPDTILDAKKVGFNRDGTQDLRAALGEDKAFPQPKPVALVRYLIDLVCDRDSLVLDFFAGSGTTGEAVVRANAADGGTRRYVLVQVGEPMPSSPRFATIADLTRARMRGVRDLLLADGVDVDCGFRAMVVQ